MIWLCAVWILYLLWRVHELDDALRVVEDDVYRLMLDRNVDNAIEAVEDHIIKQRRDDIRACRP